MAPVEKALRLAAHEQILVHTGQHFDANLSSVFFDQLGIPKPDVNLGVGSGSHAGQTAAVMVAIEPIFKSHQPDVAVVYGDVNSTMAGALVATKLGIPVVHVEAGLRSKDRTMPEEINRLVVDSISDQLFTTAEEASYNLIREGIDPLTVHFVGNPMIDTLLRHRYLIDDLNPARQAGIAGDYAIVTLHRPGNVDREEDAAAIASMLSDVASNIPVLFPIHPRAASRLSLRNIAGLHVVDPLGYLEFLAAMSRSSIAITDSGGVQEETTVLGVPCLTVRPNTERPVTISHGTNELVHRDDVASRMLSILQRGEQGEKIPPLWDGKAGARIAALIESRF